MVAYCALCPPLTACVVPNTDRMHTHYVTADMLPDIKRELPSIAKNVAVGSAICCLHFVSSHPQRFRTWYSGYLLASESKERAAAPQFGVAATTLLKRKVAPSPSSSASRKKTSAAAAAVPVASQLTVPTAADVRSSLEGLRIAPQPDTVHACLHNRQSRAARHHSFDAVSHTPCVVMECLDRGMSLPDTIVRELVQSVMTAPQPVNKQLDDIAGDATKCTTSDITAQVFSYERLTADTDLCATILGVASDELVFVDEQLRLAGSTTSQRDAVLLLAFMRRSFSMNELGKLINRSATVVFKCVHRAAKLLHMHFQSSAEFEGKLLFPTLEALSDAVKQRPGAFPDWTIEMPWLFVDGTSLETNEPLSGVQARDLYVYYKKHSAFRWTCLCDASGRVVFVTKCEIGAINDTNVWKAEKITDVLEKAYPPAAAKNIAAPVEGVPFQRQLCVGADQGYSTLDSGKTFRLVVTASGEKETKKKGLKPGDVTFCTTLARARSVVERVFGALKRRHGILDFYDCPTTLVDSVFLDQLILIAVTLLNRRLAVGELKL